MSASYEDELVKTNGKWLFTKRKIYNEGRDVRGGALPPSGITGVRNRWPSLLTS